MQERPSAPQIGAEEDKNAVFARVWRRVMGDQPMACPIVWDTGGASPTQAPEAPEGAEPSEEATQEAGTKACALPAPPPGCRPAGDFPREDTMGVLGPGSLDSAPVLQTLLRRELADAREYQQLSRRASGPPARMLAALSGEKKHRAKRLAAAYFLISGVRYWPEGEKCPPMPSYLGTLRRRFAQEQTTMAAYLTGIETTDDPCLRQLFYELAQGAWDHACKVRELVEMA